MRFTDSELAAIGNALRVAAEVYGEDADAWRNVPRIAEQFRQQQADAQRLIERIERETE